MGGTSIARIVALSAALVATGGGALVLAIAHLQHEPPVEARAVTVAPAISPSSTGVQDQGLATAQAEKDTSAAILAVSPNSPGTGDEPVFDIARIEPSGDAVIAGRAAPGASVELLRGGELHDRVVTDQSGQFVMVPPRLPPGDYELTLRSRQPDGKQATSKQRVVVALQPGHKERPVMALITPDRPSIASSKPSGVAEARRGRGGFRGGDGGGRFRGFRGTYGGYGYGGDGFEQYPYYGYGYWYGCWIPGPYGRPIYICH
jgi:hypothetical protein